MADRAWTISQQQCIDARGGTVLVSAAAGSGKTAVLIERVIGLLEDPVHPADIDTFLIVTFTKAASAEMRARLNIALSERLAKDPQSRHLLRQQMLLPQANICTIDSFCTQLLREHAQKAGVSPRFRVAEEGTLQLMKQDAASQVIEQAYQQQDPAFLQLCDILSGDKDDSPLQKQVLRLYEFIQAHPFPMQWLAEQESRFDLRGDIGQTAWGTLLMQRARELLEASVVPLKEAIRLAETDERTVGAYLPALTAYLDSIRHALKQMAGSWDDAYTAMKEISLPGFKSLTKFDNADLKDRIFKLRDQAKDAVCAAENALCFTQEEAKKDIAYAAPCVYALFSLVRRFDEVFCAAKAEQNLLDFNDLEHRALTLLASPDENGGFVRTDTARDIGARFSHILVDEYQDTNATQDTLFSALSDEEKNLFFVGDVKQSIYGFRQAMPAIFQRRREEGHPYDGQHFPACVTLGNNFRSRRQVTETVNFFFERLMTKEVGGLSYEKEDALVASRSFPAEEDPCYDSELLIVDGCPTADAAQAEARLIGRRILEMTEHPFFVTQGSELRRATYGDFCILLRSTAKWAPLFVKELQKMGIPVSGGDTESFFKRAEIQLALSFLRIIDNPLLDISLIAVLLSPLYAFSADELAAVRTAAPKPPLFTAMRRAAKGDTPLAVKCRRFLDTLDTYRMLAAALPADQLLRRIYEDTGLLSIVGARSGGTQRMANLRQLYDHARRFEQDDFRGLSAFVRYLNKLEKQNISLPGSQESMTTDMVQIMTVHHSKGLEFPVVFVAGLGNQFVTSSVNSSLLLHAEAGVGLMRRDRHAFVKSNTIHRKALAAAITRSEQAENLRVLYVAMTRAKDKLILTAATDSLPSSLAKMSTSTDQDGHLLPAALLRARNILEWILSASLCHPGARALRELLPAYADVAVSDSSVPLHISVLAADSTKEPAPVSSEQAEALRIDNLSERIHYQYPYAALGHIPAKLTASEIADRSADPLHTSSDLQRPAFLNSDGLTPAQRGTAIHAFLQYAELSNGCSAAQQAQQLIDRGLLSSAQGASLPLARLQRFMDSPLAARMAASPLLLREFPFAVKRPVADFAFDLSELPADAAKESVMVQGIADALFEEDGELVIVDYKSDRIQAMSELVDRYRAQLLVYAEALSVILKRPVKDCLMYSFYLGESISVY